MPKQQLVKKSSWVVIQLSLFFQKKVMDRLYIRLAKGITKASHAITCKDSTEYDVLENLMFRDR